MMKPRVTYDPYDPDLWGEPQQPPTPMYRCPTCDDTVTPGWKETHDRLCPGRGAG